MWGRSMLLFYFSIDQKCIIKLSIKNLKEKKIAIVLNALLNLFIHVVFVFEYNSSIIISIVSTYGNYDRITQQWRRILIE